MIWNTYEMSSLHRSRAKTIFVVDGCQFGPSLIFVLKMDLIECVDLVGGTTDHSFLFPYLIWYNELYEFPPNCLHYTSAMPHPFLLLIAANLVLTVFLGWKWSLWPVPTWLELQRRKYFFSMTLYDTINYMKHFQNVCIIFTRATSIFVVDCCQFGPNWIFGLKMELMACSNLVGGTTEQSCLFPDHKC